MNTATNSGKDPRCPVCGNAVIGGISVQGNEGTYHLACTQPPLRLDWPPSPQPQSPWPWYIPAISHPQLANR